MNWQGAGYLFLTAFLWGTNWPVMKFLLSEVPPFSGRVISCTIGATVMFAVAAIKGEKLMPPQGQWSAVALYGTLNFGLWMGLVAVSMLWLRASETAIVAYTLSVWTVLLARPVLGERLTITRGFGLVLGLSGVSLLMLSAPPTEAWSKLPGLVLALIGAMLFALGVVLSKRNPLKMPPFAAIGWQVGIGAVFLFIGMQFEHADFSAVDRLGWLALTWSGVMAIGVGYVTWYGALRHLPASLATIGSLVVPVVGVVASSMALGEPLGWRECGALALTLGGVAIASSRR